MNANSTYQAPSNMTLDEWYNSNSKALESKRQKQVEDAYVNQQLMNKYLGDHLANSGLSNTGAASMYYANNNSNYRNEVASINSSAQDSQLDLANKYYGYKKQEQDEADAALKEKQNTLLNMYLQKVDNSLNGYGYLDDAIIENLYTQFDKEGLGEANSNYLDRYINMNRGSEEAILKKNQDEAYKNYAYMFNDGYSNNNSNYNSYMNSIQNALNNGEINKDQFYELKAYLDESQKAVEAKSYDKNAKAFNDEILQEYDGNGKLTPEDAEKLYTRLEEVRKSIGEENYKNAYYTIMGSTESSLESEIRELKRDFPEVDTSNYIYVDGATSSSFGDWIGTGKGKKQDKLISDILDRAKKGKIMDGTVIDFNKGAGEGNYMYYNGKFYKTSAKADEKN